MKKVKFLFILFMISTILSPSFSQTEKGKFYIGGKSDLNLSLLKTVMVTGEEQEEQTSTMLNLEPEIGYFIVDDFVIGIGVPFIRHDYDWDNQNYYIASFGAIPFVQYYASKGKIRPYFKLGIGPQYYTWNIKNNNESTWFPKDQYWDYQIALTGGLAIFATDYLSINIGLKYSQTNPISKDRLEYHSRFNIFTGMNFHL